MNEPLKEKSVRYNDNGKGLDVHSDVRNIIEPLITKLLTNPGVYAQKAAQIYTNVVEDLATTAQKMNIDLEMVGEHKRIAAGISNDPASIMTGKSFDFFKRNLQHAIITLQRMDTQPWLDIIEHKIATVVATA